MLKPILASWAIVYILREQKVNLERAAASNHSKIINREINK